MKALRLLAFASGLTVFAAVWAHAQQPITPMGCGSAEQVINGLKTDFGEVPTFGGVDAKGVRVILFLNAETGTWTLVISPASAIVCGVTEGERGSLVKVTTPGKDS